MRHLLFILFLLPIVLFGQKKGAQKDISPELFGLFFEDINYAADGGLYAELVQNRSFEYSPTDNRKWHSFTSWDYITPVFSYGSLNVETTHPIHPNNPHYAVLNIEHIGVPSSLEQHAKLPQNQGRPGVGLKNEGFDHTIVKAGENYNFSMFARLMTAAEVDFVISLQDPKGHILAEKTLQVSQANWQKFSLSLSPSADCDSTSLVVLAVSTGKVALDMISLFPEKTFKGRANGLRADLAQLLADMKPSFIRFPGGCLVHGDGLGNMYRWENTVGPVETRKAQKNIWGYHQTAGLGYFEYFQFCEDIGAKPLPVLPAAVSCQNSGGTWLIGGTGQCALPADQMDAYIQEVKNLIEWANGPVDSKWGAVRAAAGHPEPFGLEYIGIGNEDKITADFELRFKAISQALQEAYPDIKIIGTSGPFHSGEDFDKGWEVATESKIETVDEHYYVQPEWLLQNQHRYDGYDRSKPHVYLGEYASWGNKLKNAIAEAAFMTGLERNGDIVSMASYAPLLAKKNHTQWKTDMIFFDNAGYYLTPNYHVQQLFSVHSGDSYLDGILDAVSKDSLVASSAVMNSATDEVILKMVNASTEPRDFTVNLKSLKNLNTQGIEILLTGNADDENSFDHKNKVAPVQKSISINKNFTHTTPPMSLTLIRINSK